LQPLLGNPEYEWRESQIRPVIAHLYIDLDDYQTAEAVLEPIEHADAAADARVHITLAQGRYDDVEDVIHTWNEGAWSRPLYEMVIGHDDHARDGFDEIASENDLLAGTDYFDWGYYPAVNAAHLYLRGGDAETAAAMLEESRQALNPALDNQYLAGGAYYLLASISAIEGKTDAALDMLEEAIASGWTRHWYAPRDTNLESLWDEPRFQALIAGVRTEMDRLRLAM
jgi:tetratricopeptide (TPR) repeat protein